MEEMAPMSLEVQEHSGVQRSTVVCRGAQWCAVEHSGVQMSVVQVCRVSSVKVQ